jgi:hypothetical protein
MPENSVRSIRMARRVKCPQGFICSDTTTLWIVVLGLLAVAGMIWWYQRNQPAPQPPVVVVQQAPPPSVPLQQTVRPELYPEPVRRLGIGIPQIASRGPVGRYEQVGILTGEGGSSGSAAPDRTILPLYGRELDPRRGKWNYYTRTDGQNPVQIPVRVRNRVCDDDTNGCDEVGSDDSIHVPALGRSFKATVYKKSVFG